MSGYNLPIINSCDFFNTSVIITMYFLHSSVCSIQSVLNILDHWLALSHFPNTSPLICRTSCTRALCNKIHLVKDCHGSSAKKNRNNFIAKIIEIKYWKINIHRCEHINWSTDGYAAGDNLDKEKRRKRWWEIVDSPSKRNTLFSG